MGTLYTVRFEEVSGLSAASRIFKIGQLVADIQLHIQYIQYMYCLLGYFILRHPVERRINVIDTFL